MKHKKVAAILASAAAVGILGTSAGFLLHQENTHAYFSDSVSMIITITVAHSPTGTESTATPTSQNPTSQSPSPPLTSTPSSTSAPSPQEESTNHPQQSTQANPPATTTKTGS